MRFCGRIVEWDDARGFGFVASNGEGQRAFLHVSAFRPGARRPRLDDMITYEVSLDERGRRNASLAQYGAGRTAGRIGTGGARGWWRFPFAALAALVLAAAALSGWVPKLIALCIAVASALCFAAYGFDKSAAQRGARRIPERNLHFLALIGGWPGALVAQAVFRHKSSKTSFQIEFWVSVGINLALLAWLIDSGRAQALQQVLLGQ